MASTNAVFKDNILNGKVAFVTGGGSGICKGMTEALMRHGCSSVIVSRTLSKLEVAAKELSEKTGKPCLPLSADVRNPDEVIAVVNKAIEHFGKIDILINGAAGNFLAPVENLSARAFKTVIDIDLIGTYNVTKACLDHLKKSKGKIINVSATLQYAGTPMMAHAVAAKAGIDGLTKVLSTELGEYGITCNCIAPGPIEGTEGMAKLMPPGMAEQVIRSIPLRRLGTIQDIEFATIYLVSEAGSFVTGTTIVVDGGAWLTQNGMGYPDGLEMFRKMGKERAKKHRVKL